MSLFQISGPCHEATRLALANASTGFNALVAANAAAFGVTAFSIDWGATSSVQYFPCNAGPDDVEESTPFKYPCVFHYAVQSSNEHEQYGAHFSGPVSQALSFHFTDDSVALSRTLEKIGNLVESVVNTIFADGNWPQNFGANAVCGRLPMTRGPIEPAGESQRQSFTFRLMFTAVAN